MRDPRPCPSPAAVIYPPPLPLGLEILSCCDGRAFGKHLHDGYVLWLNSESGEQYQVAGNSDVLEPGAVSLIEPGVVHSNRPCDATRRHLRSFYFSQDFLSETLSRKLERRLPMLRTARFGNRALWERLAGLHGGILTGADGLWLEEEMVETFSLLYEHCGVADASHTVSGDGRLRRLMDFLYENTELPISLADLAGLAQCSEHHVIRMFRRHTGLPPHAFLSQLRLEKARQLLDAGMTIAEAAAHSGLCDQSHLTRKFKARYGVTPGRYRSQRGLT